MNADAFRHYFAYHFNENRTLWETYVVPLTDKQFVRENGHSHGSVRNQLVHLMSVDDTWFCGLRGEDIPEPLNPADYSDRQALRGRWDTIEQKMRAYLADLRDDTLTAKPFPEGEDQDLIVWQVLLHVCNHGTDHRTQILRQLHDMGIRTVSQDYIFYVYDNP